VGVAHWVIRCEPERFHPANVEGRRSGITSHTGGRHNTALPRFLSNFTKRVPSCRRDTACNMIFRVVLFCTMVTYCYSSIKVPFKFTSRYKPWRYLWRRAHHPLEPLSGQSNLTQLLAACSKQPLRPDRQIYGSLHGSAAHTVIDAPVTLGASSRYAGLQGIE